jgi:membrane associated rhomboid family serine protease
MGQRASESFFESPHAITYILILLNSAIFAVTLFGNSLMSIDSATLYQYGALYKPAFEGHEYWRLITYAFLHGNIIHLGLNMLCIGAWAGMLENRLGATYFLIVYLASAVGGGIASMEGHGGAFLTVGASGAISGIVGGLLCLTILGKLPLTLQFFMVVIGINVLFSMNAARVDWLAHLGGFTAGFAVCALLDTAENLNRYWLRCKFPEFVKSGIAAAFTGAALLYFQQGGQGGIGPLAAAAGAIAGLVIAIKLADIILVRPKGLAVMTVAAAVFWGILGYAAGAVAARYQLYSSIELYGILPSAEAFREHIALWPVLLAAGGFLAALFLLRTELRRGLNDPGFVATSLTAARRRRQGL